MFDLDHVFTYHDTTPEQLPHYLAVRAAAKEFARSILAHTPAGADQAAALRKVREAHMTANAAIALGGSLTAPADGAAAPAREVA